MCMMNVFQLIVRNFFSRMSRCSSFFNHHVGIKKNKRGSATSKKKNDILFFFSISCVRRYIYLFERRKNLPETIGAARLAELKVGERLS